MISNSPPCVILRPASVYGPGDLTGITPRLCVAAVYKQLGNEKMKYLWDEKLRINCVHVRDLVAAMWVAATSITPGTTYNICEASDLNQGTLNTYLGDIFGIKTGFVGSTLSSLAKVMNDRDRTSIPLHTHCRHWYHNIAIYVCDNDNR
jgi:nucleoside-diphosphate-sugar epimerase